MIRVNLLGGERQAARTPFTFGVEQRITAACSCVLVVTLAALGWWYWSLDNTSKQLDTDIAAAQQDVLRLRGLLHEVEVFEARRTQLQQRVTLIEQLRKGQSVPVQLLDHISRSLPDMLWLTSFEETPQLVTIEGRSTTLIALSDFVGNLGNTELLKKPIEIVNSQVEPGSPATANTPAGPDLIKFTVKAQLAGAPQAAANLTGAERAALAKAQAGAGAPAAR